MKSFHPTSKNVFGGLLAAAMGLLSISAAHAQIYAGSYNLGAIGEFNTNGVPADTSLISGVTPFAIAISGQDLFVISGGGTVGEYTTAGATINASLITGLSSTGEAEGIAVSGSNLYITRNIYQEPNLSENYGAVSEYTLGSTPGTVTSSTPSLVSGTLDLPVGIAVSGQDLFVANADAGTIGEYTTSGGIVNTSLITGLNGPESLAISGSTLFVENEGSGTIGEYTLGSTPGTVTSSIPSLITGFGSSFEDGQGLAVSGSELFVQSSTKIGEYTLGANGTVTSSIPSLISQILIPNKTGGGQYFDYNYGIAVVGQTISVQPTSTPTTLAATGSGANYSNVTPVTSTGGFGSKVALIDGANTSGSPQTVTLASTNLGGNFTSLASDVVSVSGNAGNVFTVQLTFDLNAANQLGGSSAMQLLWLNQEGQWVNAVAGNDGGTATNMGDGAYNSAIDFHLGYYGFDDENGQDYVWAVIDHNSDFGAGNLAVPPIQAAPEPSTWVMLIVGALGLFVYGRSRTRQALL